MTGSKNLVPTTGIEPGSGLLASLITSDFRAGLPRRLGFSQDTCETYAAKRSLQVTSKKPLTR